MNKKCSRILNEISDNPKEGEGRLFIELSPTTALKIDNVRMYLNKINGKRAHLMIIGPKTTIIKRMKLDA